MSCIIKYSRLYGKQGFRSLVAGQAERFAQLLGFVT